MEWEFFCSPENLRFLSCGAAEDSVCEFGHASFFRKGDRFVHGCMIGDPEIENLVKTNLQKCSSGSGYLSCGPLIDPVVQH